MKSRASLFLTVLLLALSLTACGKGPPRTIEMTPGPVRTAPTTPFPDPNRNNAPNNDAIIGRDDNTVTARTPIPPQPRQ